MAAVKPKRKQKYDVLQVRNSLPHVQKILAELDQTIIAVVPTFNNVHVMIFYEVDPA